MANKFAEFEQNGINPGPLKDLDALRVSGDYQALRNILFSKKDLVVGLPLAKNFYYDNLQVIAESISEDGKYVYPLLYKNLRYAQALWAIFYIHHQNSGKIQKEINFLELSKLYEKYLEANRQSGYYLVDEDAAQLAFSNFVVDMYASVKSYYNQNNKNANHTL